MYEGASRRSGTPLLNHQTYTFIYSTDELSPDPPTEAGGKEDCCGNDND